MPVSRAIRDFMVAHPPTPEGQPKEELSRTRLPTLW
jgi:hypothetical protein